MKIYNKLIFAILALSVIACGNGFSDAIPGLGNSTSFTETFTGTNNAAWPGSWSTVSSAATISVDIQSNRGRLRSNTYDGISSTTALTRVINSSVNLQDVDAVFTVEFEDFANQGVGFYVRQNGGYLTELATNSQGYGVFLQGNNTVGEFALIYELNGVESPIQSVNNLLTLASVLNNTAYRIRFQVKQNTRNDTLLRAKVWLASDTEPATWDIIYTTSSISGLQEISGGIAVDLFNYSGTSSIYIDDISVTVLN